MRPKNYLFSFVLLGSIILGIFGGLILGPRSVHLRPLGELFLNLLLTIVVPFVFFSITSAIMNIRSKERLGKMMGATFLVFTATGIIASILMIIALKLFPPHLGLELGSLSSYTNSPANVSDLLVSAVATSDFVGLLSKKNILPLIVFSILLGLAISASGEKAKPLIQFIEAGNVVFNKLIHLIMYYAPVGLGAYFAYLIGVFGPELLGAYAKAMAIYYPLAALYFLVGFSFYVIWARGLSNLVPFWKSIIPTTLTALATGSSVASIPLNLQAADANGVPKDVRELVIPIGATMHMDGSCLSAILKIGLLLGIYQGDFAGPSTYLMAIGVALVSSTVMAGIPGGGLLGEALILTLYGFPPESYAILAAIGTLVDPVATLVNAVGDNVAAQMVTKLMGGRKMEKGQLAP